MSIRRFFVDKVEPITKITGDEYKHAAVALRLKVGDKVLLCSDGETEYECCVTEITNTYFAAKVESERQNEAEPKTEVCLACGYLKGDKTELVVQKAVELGIKRIIVFNSEYCSAYMNENKLARLKRVSVEAAKQCGRSVIPTVEYADKFPELLNELKKYKNRLFAYENLTNYATHIGDISGDTAIIVGSEGGFSAAEAESANSVGFTTITLGKRILRAETCAIALTAIILEKLGELS